MKGGRAVPLRQNSVFANNSNNNTNANANTNRNRNAANNANNQSVSNSESTNNTNNAYQYNNRPEPSAENQANYENYMAHQERFQHPAYRTVARATDASEDFFLHPSVNALEILIDEFNAYNEAVAVTELEDIYSTMRMMQQLFLEIVEKMREIEGTPNSYPNIDNIALKFAALYRVMMQINVNIRARVRNSSGGRRRGRSTKRRTTRRNHKKSRKTRRRRKLNKQH